MPEYINNKDFEEQIKTCTSKKPTEKDALKLVQMLYLLAENIIRAFQFKMIDKEDALQEAVLICLQKKHKFNSDKGKAFNYFTTIILNHFRQLYRSARNYQELKKRFLERQMLLVGDLNSGSYKGKNQVFEEA